MPLKLSSYLPWHSSAPTSQQSPEPSESDEEQLIAPAGIEQAIWEYLHWPTYFINLQIDAPGNSWVSILLPTKPEPIQIHRVSPYSSGTISNKLHLTSVRPGRISRSCFLVSHGWAGKETVVTTTTYSFSPGKPPVIALPNPGQDEGEIDICTVTSPSMSSRSQVFRSPFFGNFTWRYASRSERENLVPGADSILLLEKEYISSHDSCEVRINPIGVFVRSAQFRTPGSSANSAGNGGKLTLNLDYWDPDGGDCMEDVVHFAVTSLLHMLKKEVDRRYVAQAAIILAGAALKMQLR